MFNLTENENVHKMHTKSQRVCCPASSHVVKDHAVDSRRVKNFFILFIGRGMGVDEGPGVELVRLNWAEGVRNR